MNPCVICKKSTKNKCSNCNLAFYCSEQHQKDDWKSHKTNCHPFKINHNEELGRHLVTTRNIKPFEILIKEAALIKCPSQITSPVCLGCLNEIEPSDYINCDKCGWPLCGIECKNKEDHRAECELTVNRKRKVNIQEFTNPHPLYQCIGAIRCLLLSRTDSNKSKKLFELESLQNHRRGSMQWKADLESIGKFIPRFFSTNEFAEEEIMTAIGVLQINGHEVPTTDPPHVAVFYKASLLEHSCKPNLAKSFTKNGDIILWAPKEIKKNTHLSICYSDAVWGTADRQRHLMHTKLFKCNCERCVDVTELNTNYDAFKCSSQDCSGLVLPISWTDWSSNWRCNSCETNMDNLYVGNILDKAGKDINAMQKSEDGCMKYIDFYSKWLVSQHFFLSQVKIQLVQQIGKDANELTAVSDEKLELKIKYAKELITLYEILTPCEVRMLGLLCFELHSAIAEQTRRESQRNAESTKSLLHESLKYVEKCIDYLQYESDIFVEGLMLKQAKINRNALKMVLLV